MAVIKVILNVKSIYYVITQIKDNVCVNSSKEKHI